MTNPDTSEAVRVPPTLNSGADQIDGVYCGLDAEQSRAVDRKWARQRGYILPTDGTSALSLPRAVDGGAVDLREANEARQAEWDPSDQITLAYRGNELAGEVGEACNILKKLERERLGIRGSRATKEQLAEELADVVICTDLIAMQAGIDLNAAVRDKFNATSERYGLKTRLSLPRVSTGGAAGEPVDLERLVERFSKRLLAKLKLARANGRSGWEKDDWEADCQRGLLRHIEKGDPRDVAAYCAFMDYHGWITKSASPLPLGAVEREAIIEECAKHLEHEADVATNSLHCGDNSQTIAATHRVSRAYHEAAKSIRALAVPRSERLSPGEPS